MGHYRPTIPHESCSTMVSSWKLARRSGQHFFGTLLVGLLALSGELTLLAKPSNAQNRQTGFDQAIEQVGGIQKGQVSYVQFSHTFNPGLDVAIRRTLQNQLNNYLSSNISYSYLEADLNGDGQKEAFVQINHSIGSGSGGSHTWVFQFERDRYNLVHVFLHQISLVILPSTTFGWRDIFVVPGKLFNPNYGLFYYKCSYNPRVENHYTDCQKAQRGSYISGEVINTMFDRERPKFNLQ